MGFANSSHLRPPRDIRLSSEGEVYGGTIGLAMRLRNMVVLSLGYVQTVGVKACALGIGRIW